MFKFEEDILRHIEINIEGTNRKLLAAVVKNSDLGGRVSLGKRFGNRKFLILAIEYLDPQDRIFIETNNKSEMPCRSIETSRITEARKSDVSQLDPLAKSALKFILKEFSEKREPSMKEVADHLEIGTRKLGSVLRPLGIETESTTRNWKPMRLYRRKLRTTIEGLLKA